MVEMHVQLFTSSYHHLVLVRFVLSIAISQLVMLNPQTLRRPHAHACQSNVEDAKAAFPLVQADNLPYLCIDLTYQYTLLVDGFAIYPHQVITLVKQVPYGDASVEAAWPLGSAIEVASSSSSS